jgi:hypothetical protein
MAVQLAAYAAVVGCIALVLVRGLRRGGRSGRALVIVGAVGVPAFAIAIGALGTWRTSSRALSYATLVHEVPQAGLRDEGFVSSDRCLGCHPGEYHAWHQSYHRTMTQPATPEAVIPDIDGPVELELKGRRYRIERRGDEFWAQMPDPEWEGDAIAKGVNPYLLDPDQHPRSEKRIVMTTGSHHMQTYWVADDDDGKLYNFPFTWLNDDRRWVARDDVFMRPPNAVPMFGTWHNNCIECHATASEADHDASAGTYAPRVAELGIACEACHGPGEQHIRANQDPIRRLELRRAGQGDPTIVNPARLSPRASAQVCGQCHSMNLHKTRPLAEGKRYRAGGNLFETRIVLRLSPDRMTEEERRDWRNIEVHIANQIATESPSFVEDRLWPDGMVRVSGRDYTAMVESECFAGGELSCLSCHAMHGYESRVHQLKPEVAGKGGDEGCLQCHGEYRDDVEAHTRHPAGSPGSACVNCHMPRTVYGLMTAIRSHLIDSPSAAVTVATGRPDACSLCHLDRSLGWVSYHLSQGWGQESVALSRDEESIAGGVRWTLTGNANLRALVAWHMGWEPALEASGRDWMAPYLGHLLADPYAVVRNIAHHSLQRHRGFERFAFDYVGPLEARSSARERAVGQWMSQRRPPLDRFGPHLLMDDAGALDFEHLTTLSRQRDDRPMDLRE